MNWTARLVVTVFFMIPLTSMATDPGQAQDCSDWQPEIPGIGCEVAAWECSPNDPDCVVSNSTRQFSNHGELFIARECCERTTECEGYNSTLRGTEIVVLKDGVESLVGRWVERCAQYSNRIDRVSFRGPYERIHESEILFDRNSGELLVALNSQEGTSGVNKIWTARLTGFASTFDVLQSFTPDNAQLSFRVPYMPEGMPGADWFDTYWGDLASVGNWASAQPLRCGYPATIPSVGDYLTVTDPLPVPEPGHGYYYVTAATYAGETRYGRKASGGVLSGRDPAVLPACE